MIKLCIFDLDGTLANTIETIAFCLNEALVKYGFSKISISKYKEIVGNGADVLVRKALLESSGTKDEEQIKKIHDYYDRMYCNNPIYLTSSYDGIPNLLTGLCNTGILVSINSNKPDDMTKAVTNALFKNIDFVAVLGQRIDVPKKPLPNTAYEIMDICGVKKSECVYIGDSEVDIRTAKNAGIISIGVAWGFRGEATLIREHADFIAHKPSDIMDIISELN